MLDRRPSRQHGTLDKSPGWRATRRRRARRGRPDSSPAKQCLCDRHPAGRQDAAPRTQGTRGGVPAQGAQKGISRGSAIGWMTQRECTGAPSKLAQRYAGVMGRQLLVLWSRATVCGGLSFGARMRGRRVSTEFDGGPGEAGGWKQPAVLSGAHLWAENDLTLVGPSRLRAFCSIDYSVRTCNVEL